MVANWGFDPLPLVRSLEVPVLYFFGTNDTVMPAGAMTERVKTELPSDSAQNVEPVVVHDGGHSMLEAWPIMAPLCYCRPMSPESNGFLDLAPGFIPRFVPEYRVRVTSWVLEVVGK